jgi:hypothetical protein
MPAEALGDNDATKLFLGDRMTRIIAVEESVGLYPRGTPCPCRCRRLRLLAPAIATAFAACVLSRFPTFLLPLLAAPLPPPFAAVSYVDLAGDLLDKVGSIDAFNALVGSPMFRSTIFERKLAVEQHLRPISKAGIEDAVLKAVYDRKTKDQLAKCQTYTNGAVRQLKKHGLRLVADRETALAAKKLWDEGNVESLDHAFMELAATEMRARLMKNKAKAERKKEAAAKEAAMPEAKRASRDARKEKHEAKQRAKYGGGGGGGAAASSAAAGGGGDEEEEEEEEEEGGDDDDDDEEEEGGAGEEGNVLEAAQIHLNAATHGKNLEAIEALLSKYDEIAAIPSKKSRVDERALFKRSIVKGKNAAGIMMTMLSILRKAHAAGVSAHASAEEPATLDMASQMAALPEDEEGDDE